MSGYAAYLQEIEERKGLGLHAKPIDDAALLSDVIEQIKAPGHPEREASLAFFIYNVLPGTTSAAGVKAKFLKLDMFHAEHFTGEDEDEEEASRRLSGAAASIIFIMASLAVCGLFGYNFFSWCFGF